MNKFISWLALVVALVAVTAAVVGGNNQPVQNTGAVTPGTRFPSGITVGNPANLGAYPTNISKVIAGECNARLVGTTFAATSSAMFLCDVTGVRAGDYVNVALPVGAGINPTGAGAISGGFIVGTSFATTSNVIGFSITNMTGAATTSFSQATTSVEYLILGVQ